jgi:cobalt-zinc-cadmium efflux system membrane fusion protein
MKKRSMVLWVVATGSIVAVFLGYNRFASPPLERKPDTAAPTQFSHRILRYPAGAPQLAYLRVEKAEASPVSALEPLHGRIAYDDNVTARVSPSIAGRVVKIGAQAGDKVAAGQPLLWLDSPDYAQALADLHKAELDLRQKQLSLGRAKMLFEGEVLARKDFESAENDMHQSEAEAERARARFRNLNPVGSIKEGFALRAPLSGIVTERQANPGTEVRPDAPGPLYVITNPARLWVIVELPEKDLAKVRVGQPVTVEVDAYPDEHFPAKILAIGDVVDPATRRVAVRCQLPNDKHLLKPEMYARVTPSAEGVPLPRVPNPALVTEGLHTYLFVETEPGVLERRLVVLAFRGQEASYVKEGLAAGERVVTAGALLLNAELAGN